MVQVQKDFYQKADFGMGKAYQERHRHTHSLNPITYTVLIDGFIRPSMHSTSGIITVKAEKGLIRSDNSIAQPFVQFCPLQSRGFSVRLLALISFGYLFSTKDLPPVGCQPCLRPLPKHTFHSTMRYTSHSFFSQPKRNNLCFSTQHFSDPCCI